MCGLILVLLWQRSLCEDLLCVLQVSAVDGGGTYLKSPHVMETKFLSALVRKIDFFKDKISNMGILAFLV